jgi:bla regulator protein blaR1
LNRLPVVFFIFLCSHFMIPLLQLVVSNILVASLIAALAWQVGRSGRRARLAHVLWVIFFVKLITPPIVLLPIEVPETWLPEQWTQTASPYQAISQRLVLFSTNTVAPVDETATGQLPTVSQVGAAITVASSGWSSLTWICSLWLLGCLFVVVRGLTRFMRFHRLLHREGTLDEEATSYVRQLLTQESHRSAAVRCPKVLRLPIRVSPMLFGFGRRAVIVCPDQLWQSLSTDNRNGFLAHETAHFYRRDHWVRWLEWVDTAANWWLPLVYIARRQLERHEEACCDAWAVSRLQLPPRSYAEALLRVVDFISDHEVGIPRLASGM